MRDLVKYFEIFRAGQLVIRARINRFPLAFARHFAERACNAREVKCLRPRCTRSIRAPRHRNSKIGETSRSGLKVTGVDSRSPVWTFYLAHLLYCTFILNEKLQFISVTYLFFPWCCEKGQSGLKPADPTATPGLRTADVVPDSLIQ